MKAAGIPINRGMALAPARVVPPWPVFSDEKREFHTPKERQIASVQNAVSSLSAFYTESANNFYAIGDNTRGDIMVVHNAILHDHSLQEEIIRQIRYCVDTVLHEAEIPEKKESVMVMLKADRTPAPQKRIHKKEELSM